MKKMFHQFVSVVLTVALVMGAVVSAASAASLSYADHLLAGQTYSTAQETAIRGGIEKAPENIVSFLVREGLSLETEEECPGFSKASGACAVTSGTVVYVYDNAVEKNVVHEMGHVYANVLGLNPRPCSLPIGINWRISCTRMDWRAQLSSGQTAFLTLSWTWTTQEALSPTRPPPWQP